MKLFVHCCPRTFANAYVVGTEDTEEAREALVVDPGCMDTVILGFIENNGYQVRGVLLTHDHITHTGGLKTLKRIYNADIYAMNQTVLGHRSIMVRDMDVVTAGPFRFEVISVPGHSPDSVVFKLEGLLFTGDALTAGLVGSTASSYGAAAQVRALRTKVLSLAGDWVVLPGHGPPSSLEAERHFNAGIRRYEERALRPGRI
ncbi:MAG: MBL fold metallo-hydrolase [Spirochaetaceae bacterium]|nr:MBL fold metallo-hydrolase [Spirochaetaceae bacterium]